jgi:hypothetical protein
MTKRSPAKSILFGDKNHERFPEDFMFQLTRQEHENLILQNAISSQEGNKTDRKNWRSQFVTSSGDAKPENPMSQTGISSWAGTRKMPYAFTEQGIIMLSSVLNSQRAIEVNIRVVRIFIRLREMMSTNKEILHKLEQLEHRMDKTDKKVKTIFEVLRKLIISEEQASRKTVGYKRKNE